MRRTALVHHQAIELRFAVPNSLNRFRLESFATKEPETLEWIDGIPSGSVVWDIGANIGLYTCYAAKARGCRVFAFEPSVFNLELLARNVFLNGLTSNVVIVPIPLCDATKFSTLNMTSMEWGGALSTFGNDFGWDGKKIQTVFDFQTIGITMDGVNRDLDIPMPDFIKIDVDGIEHLILKGGGNVLRSVKGLLIEVNDRFREQADQCQKLLAEAGMILKEKRHADIYDGADSFGGGAVWNQIWVRKIA